MNKRLEKRHKRQVSRTRSRVRLSQPDVRTPEQIAAAREASRAVGIVRKNPHANYATPPSHAALSTGGADTEETKS